MTLLLSACVSSQTSPPRAEVVPSAVERLRQPAENHATALVNGDVSEVRRTGLTLLELLYAYAGWEDEE